MPRIKRTAQEFQLLKEELACSRLEIEKQNREMVDLRGSLEQSHEGYMELYEFAPVLYATFSSAGIVLDMNLKGLATLGLPHGEIIHRRFHPLVHPEDHALFSSHLRRCLDTDQEVISELRILVDNGQRHLPVQLTSIRTLHSQRRIDILPTVIIDISPRKKVEEELRKREQELAETRKMEAIGRLAGGVAHDFNNLITGVLGISQEIREGLAAENRYQDDLDLIMQSCQHAFSLTRQLLAFSRREIARLIAMDINRTVRKMENLLRRLLGEDVELQVQLCQEPAVIKGDEGQMEQILTNLLINAREAMPKGGRIRIETSLTDWRKSGGAEQQPGVRLCVTDSGTGIDEKTLKHIFEPFFTTKGPAKGTGLGLATVYGITKQSGGDIEVTSRPGEGTTFELFFPRVAATPTNDRRKPGQRTVHGGQETILLVEDNTIVQKVTRQLLQKYGYQVVMAGNGQEALTLFKAYGERIKLIITDIVMPGMDGGDLAEEIKAIAPSVPILFMSGYSGDRLTSRQFPQNGTAFIEKAHVSTNLPYRVRALLDAHAASTPQAASSLHS